MQIDAKHLEGEAIYYEASSNTEYTCRVVFDGDALHVYIDRAENNFFIWSVALITSWELDSDSLIVKYGGEQTQILKCTGAVADLLGKRLRGGNVIHQVEGHRLKKRNLIVVSLLLGAIILAGCTWFIVLPWLGEKAVGYIPRDVEEGLGDRLAQMYGSGINDSATYYMQRFADGLELSDEYKIRVQVINNEEINAFALPGGHIFVYSGILSRMNDYKELVALLGHEVTHVTARHSLKSICRSAAGSLVVASLFGDVTGISAGILSQADEFSQLNYSRNLESQADANGLKIMTKNKISGKGMLELLNLLREEGKEMPGLMKYLSTHPNTDARIEAVTALPEVRRVYPESEALQVEFANLKRILAKNLRIK